MLIKQFSFWCCFLDEVISSIDIEPFAFKPIEENTTQSQSSGFIPFPNDDGTYSFVLQNQDYTCLGRRKFDELCEMLDELQDVQNVYHNVK